MSATATVTPTATDNTIPAATPGAGATAAAAPAATPPAVPPATPTAEATPKPAAAPAAGDKKAAAPETYADFTLPQGVAKNDAALEKFRAKAKAMNLTQEQAQDLVTLQAEVAAEEQQKAFGDLLKLRETWVAEIQADPKLGGAMMKETVERARRAISTHGGEKLMTLLEETGLGDHPEVLRFLVKVDRDLGEDRAPLGNDTPPQKDFATLLYGGTEEKK